MKFIKTLVVGILLVGLMSVALESRFNGPVEVIQTSEVTTTPEEEEAVSYPDDWTEEAQAAFEDVIRRKQLEQELSELQGQNEQIEARMTEIEKELGTY